jgi:hypothetical protein
VSSKFTPEEIERIDKQRQPGESRAACVRRLVMVTMNEGEFGEIDVWVRTPPPRRY